MGGQTGQQRFLEIDTTPEAVPGVMNDPTAQALKYPEMVSQGYGVKETALFDEVQVEANLSAQPAKTRSGFEPQGNLEIYAAPYDSARTIGWMRFLLDWALARTSNVLDAHTLTECNPISGVEFGRRVTGCKPDTITFSLGSDNRMKNPVIGIKGMFPSKAASIESSPTFPTRRAWNFTYMGLQVAGDVFSGYKGEATIDKTCRAVEIAANNFLDFGPQGYNYSGGVLTIGPQTLDEGQMEVTGSIELELQNATEYYDRFLAGTKGQLRLLGFHPDSPVTTIDDTDGLSTLNPNQTGGAATVIANVADQSSFEIGDYVYIEDSTDADPANWIREVLYVSAVNPGAITLILNGGDTLKESIGRGQSFANGSRMYKFGIQLLLREISFEDWEPVGGAPDKIYQRFPIRAGQWTGTHPSLGASYQHPALGYMVR